MRHVFRNKIHTHFYRVVCNERGSILPYITIAVGILALLALTFMIGLGKVTLHRRDASGAADAAALAAAGVWANSLESAYNDAYKASDPDGLWGEVGRGLGSYAGLEAKNAANRYASRNNATITAYSVDPVHRTITVTVESNSSIEGVNKKMTATSTAEIVLEDGICLNGGRVGFKIDGECVIKRPKETTSPTTPPAHPQAPSQSPTPFRAPEGMRQHASITTRLVA